MERETILLARALAWIEPTELNPTGRVFYPDLAKALVARYNFQKFPQTVEEFDEAKGVTFGAGKLDSSTIEQVVIYTYGIVLDTRKSTQESKRLLEEAMQWGCKELGLTYKSSMIKRWQYASQIIFYSDAALTDMSPAIQRLTKTMTENIGQLTGERLTYEVTGVLVDYDQLSRKHPLGRFSIQRRENTPFAENKYFSEAPLPTDVHLKLLEQFEADLAKK